MAAKLLHSLTDDNPDLQKQIGCMTGVFQLFDRHHMVVAGRRISGNSPKRLPPGSSQFDNGTPERESSNVYQRPHIVEKHSNKMTQDKHRASTESSRDSFSSMSRSSSFSSIDCNINRTTHPEPDHNVFPETPSRDFTTRQSCVGRQSLDLRDVVKDSMYREARALSTPDHAVNYRESFDAVAKFQESNWYYNEPRELSRSKSYQFRDGSLISVSKDYPRFSYDGRETNRLSFQSRENTKTTPKEELPRLSLDSRESSMRIPRNPKTDERGPVQTRPPSVVAKLMGLETLPDSASASHKELGPSLGPGPIKTSLVEDRNICGPIKMPNSSRISSKEPTSPCWKNPDMKPITRFPIEPAPWKQRDGARSPHKPGSRVPKSPTKIHSRVSSVYSEVDKRLKHLEFTQSGKDLRALKQILEAMQSMEARKGEKPNTFERFSDRGNHQNPLSATRGSNHSRPVTYESPIVIMKPAKLVEKSGPGLEFPTDDRKNQAPHPKSIRRENNTVKHTKTGTGSTRQQVVTKENMIILGKTSGSISPRLQQKRLELERRSRPPTPPTDSVKTRKQLTKQVAESSSPGGKRLQKYSNTQQTGKFDYQETNCDFVVNPEFSEENVSRWSPSSIQEKSSLPLREDESLAPEYPSPVSVLDDGVYMDDSPSPVKHMLKTLTNNTTQDQHKSSDDVIQNTIHSGINITSEINRKKLQNIEHLVQKLTRLNSTHDEAHTDYIASLCENTKPNDRYISEILLASGLLLRDLTTFQFHSSGHPINPELFFVLEQTKFSNLQKHDLGTPEKMIKKEKYHRKLIFDTVNEILAGKLALMTPLIKQIKLAKKGLNAQKLLRDLCLEIEEMQVRKKSENEEEDDGLKSILWEEVLNCTESWTDYDGELPVIVLEVERLIFKDLVNEVVLGEASDGRRVKLGRRCRQLFSK